MLLCIILLTDFLIALMYKLTTSALKSSYPICKTGPHAFWAQRKDENPSSPTPDARRPTPYFLDRNSPIELTNGGRQQKTLLAIPEGKTSIIGSCSLSIPRLQKWN